MTNTRFTRQDLNKFISFLNGEQKNILDALQILNEAKDLMADLAEIEGRIMECGIFASKQAERRDLEKKKERLLRDLKLKETFVADIMELAEEGRTHNDPIASVNSDNLV